MNILKKIFKSSLILPLFFCCFLKGDALYVKFDLGENTIFGNTLQNSMFTDLLKSNLNLQILDLLKAGNINTFNIDPWFDSPDLIWHNYSCAFSI